MTGNINRRIAGTFGQLSLYDKKPLSAWRNANEEELAIERPKELAEIVYREKGGELARTVAFILGQKSGGNYITITDSIIFTPDGQTQLVKPNTESICTALIEEYNILSYWHPSPVSELPLFGKRQQTELAYEITRPNSISLLSGLPKCHSINSKSLSYILGRSQDSNYLFCTDFFIEGKDRKTAKLVRNFYKMPINNPEILLLAGCETRKRSQETFLN